MPFFSSRTFRGLIFLERGKSNLLAIRRCCVSKIFRAAFSSMEPSTIKIDTPEFHSIFTPELQVVSEIFKKYNFELRVAGGAVRDILLGKIPHDVDFATTATPQQMTDFFTYEGIRLLNKKGEKHGTVTCRINDKDNFEITTLRIDKVCDGRRAEVEYTKDWSKDANRRDLTVNSLFLGLDGTVYDYFGGLDDLKKRRIVFVGDAKQRIQEDYLRILRYFRFFGRLTNSPDKHDANTLTAIKENVGGLKGVSGERLWQEFKQIVIGRYAGYVVRELVACGVAPFLGLSNSPDVNEFEKILNHSKDVDPQPMTLVSALLTNADDLRNLHCRLKLSNKERYLGEFIVECRSDLASKIDRCVDRTARLEVLRNAVIELSRPSKKVENGRDYVVELAKYLCYVDIIDELQTIDIPAFPINGYMLLRTGVRKGPHMKDILGQLFDHWLESKCTATQDELLKSADTRYVRRISTSPERTTVKQKI